MIAGKFFVLPVLVIVNIQGEQCSPIHAGHKPENITEKAGWIFRKDDAEIKQRGGDCYHGKKQQLFSRKIFKKISKHTITPQNQNR